MKRLFLTLLFMTLFAAMAYGQGSDRKGWGYLFGGAGRTAGDFGGSFVQVGGGGEGLVYKGLGLGADLGYIAHNESIDSGVGALNANVSYHFGGKDRSRKLVPFVTGGYTLLFTNAAAANGGNFGGGIQYWMSDRIGLRFEVRDQVISSDSPHFVGGRIGITFR